MSIAKNIIDSVKEKHGVSVGESEEDRAILQKYGFNSMDELLGKPSVVTNEEAPSGGLPTSAEEPGRPLGGVAAVKFEDVSVTQKIADPVPAPAPAAVVVSDGTEDGSYRAWRSSKQGITILNTQTINLARLHAVIPDRIEAAFRAGFAAGAASRD